MPFPPLTEAEHFSLAIRLGGTPITHRAPDGRESQAIRLDTGEILFDYRQDLDDLIIALAELYRAPWLTDPNPSPPVPPIDYYQASKTAKIQNPKSKISP